MTAIYTIGHGRHAFADFLKQRSLFTLSNLNDAIREIISNKSFAIRTFRNKKALSVTAN